MSAGSARVAWGWQPDPFGIYEERYISVDGEPTKLVRDHGTECYDPPPDGAVPGRSASAGSPAPAEIAGATR